MQILRGAPAVLKAELADQNGESRPALAPITVSVRRSDGTTLIDGASVIPSPDGALEVTLFPAMTTELDLLSVEWREGGNVVITQTVEVVGGYIFSLVEARNSSTKIRDTTKYSEADILRARMAVTEELEKITGRSFVPRFKSVKLSGRYGSILHLPDYDIRRLRAVKIDNAALAPSVLGAMVTGANQLHLGGGALFSFGQANVDVAYEYGMDEPPERIKQAALLRMQSVISVLRSGVPDRAEYQIIEGRVFSLARFRNGTTGIKEVDDAYAEWAVAGQSIASVPIA